LKNILLTGRPGCGKTTLLEKIVQRLNRPLTGFLTRELRDQGRRIGFSVATLDGRQGVMAHLDIRSRCRVGRYGIDVQKIDEIAVPSMSPENEHVVVVVDEIGRMECCSTLFRKTLLQVLDSPVAIVGSIALKGDDFINAIKHRRDTLLIAVTEKNRDVLPDEILGKLVSRPAPSR